MKVLRHFAVYPLARPLRSAVALVLFTLLGWVAGCGEGTGSTDGTRPGRIILVSMDTVRADHVSGYGVRETTPTLAEIAAGSALILLVSRSKEAPLVFYDEGTTEPPGLVVAVNAILGAILGGIGGLVIGFAVGAMLVEILDVSCFEGGCGYFAAAIGLLGMLLGAVAGAVVAVWRTRRRGRTARAAT